MVKVKIIFFCIDTRFKPQEFAVVLMWEWWKQFLKEI